MIAVWITMHALCHMVPCMHGITLSMHAWTHPIHACMDSTYPCTPARVPCHAVPCPTMQMDFINTEIARMPSGSGGVSVPVMFRLPEGMREVVELLSDDDD